jgi:hypothetical protein
MRQELAPRTGIAIDRLASLLLSNRLGGTEWAGRPGLIQNNCAFWRFRSPRQAHAFSNANPRKPAFPCIDPANCKTYFWDIARDDGAELAAAEKALMR